MNMNKMLISGGVENDTQYERDGNEQQGYSKRNLKKNLFYKEWEAMNDLVSNGIPKSRSANLAGVSRSMIYYQRRKREPQYDADLEKRISHIVEERPSYFPKVH